VVTDAGEEVEPLVVEPLLPEVDPLLVVVDPLLVEPLVADPVVADVDAVDAVLADAAATAAAADAAWRLAEAEALADPCVSVVDVFIATDCFVASAGSRPAAICV
jgi:hypothetical protein